jgi:hypothetical protein
MTSEVRARKNLAAARCSVRLMTVLPPEGDGAPKSAKPMMSAILSDRGGRLAARQQALAYALK